MAKLATRVTLLPSSTIWYYTKINNFQSQTVLNATTEDDKIPIASHKKKLYISL